MNSSCILEMAGKTSSRFSTYSILTEKLKQIAEVSVELFPNPNESSGRCDKTVSFVTGQILVQRFLGSRLQRYSGLRIVIANFNAT